jgi:hypothetical protein
VKKIQELLPVQQCIVKSTQTSPFTSALARRDASLVAAWCDACEAASLSSCNTHAVVIVFLDCTWSLLIERWRKMPSIAAEVYIPPAYSCCIASIF